MKKTKFVFITGGVVSSLGKGIVASSLGRLLKNRGLKVFMQKFDPYINVDPGTMSPYQHGEVFVTDDGAETDLDLGHYERFIDENLSQSANLTAGKIYQNVLEKERSGQYLGATVQVIPHVTDEIKFRLMQAADETDADIVITEIGGTVGDIESLPFLEAIRQMRRDLGVNNTLYVHNTLVPKLAVTGELKTKPTQHSVKELRSLGINPDIIVLRTESALTEDIIDKVALFCDVRKEAVIGAKDVGILYEIVLELHRQKLDDLVCEHFKLKTFPPDMREWTALIERIRGLKKSVKIAVVGKYTAMKDAYLSLGEALRHAGYAHDTNIDIHWIDAAQVLEDGFAKQLRDVSGIVVPGGFGARDAEGKIAAIRYARENDVPFLGLCYGMQLSVIEFARHVAGIPEATSEELDPEGLTQLFHYLPGQSEATAKGGTMRLGLFSCRITPGTKAHEAYGVLDVSERHRHRYEFNNDYRDVLTRHGLVISGVNAEHNLVEIVELSENTFFIATQFHPEFVSRPQRPHPLFSAFVQAALSRN